jgi:hypothetical protein
MQFEVLQPRTPLIFNRPYSRHESEDEEEDDEKAKFPTNIRGPPAASKNKARKLKYTVWTKDVHRKEDETDVEMEFDSSFNTLKEANLRVEYVFFFENNYGGDRYSVHADTDEQREGGYRYMRYDHDGGGTWIASAIPSEAFDVLDGYTEHPITSGDLYGSSFSFLGRGSPPCAPTQASFAKSIRCPGAANTNQRKKLPFTVWTSCGYDRDGWHSYEGPPEKEFNSSYSTLEQANKRAEYVFYYENPWGLSDEELPYPEEDCVTRKGFRHMECCPDDSERWTVSVVPSIAFDFMNI